MKGVSFIAVLLITLVQGYAQNTLSGYVNSKEDNGEKPEIILTRILPGNDSDKRTTVTKVKVQEDGFFAFDDSVFTAKDEVYEVRIAYTPSGKKVLDTTINEFRTFILSNRDSLRFTRSNPLFSGYSTTNAADKEWKKLKEYEEQIAAIEKDAPEDYLTQTRNYTKDSLQILLVKLLSIKTLDEKKLLEKDIKENADYYLDLLGKLRASDLEPSSYAYLENKIRATHQDIIERKYRISLVLNFLGFAGIVGLLFVVFKVRRKSETTPSIPLSRQEENIKDLILQGKTNKEIAGELFISISTVKTHTSNIYSKLNVSNRKELMVKYQIHTGTST